VRSAIQNCFAAKNVLRKAIRSRRK
jgi:hypothetical protein